MQYTPNIIENISEVLNNEYIYTAKEFKQKKGTVPAIEYAYNAIRGTGLQTIEVNTDLQDKVFSIKEGTDTENIPFIFRVEGSLYKEVYENTVKPIVHPVGFGYLYSKLSSLFFDEFVNVYVTYPNTIVKVVCIVGNSLDYSGFTVTNIKEEKDEFFNEWELDTEEYENEFHLEEEYNYDDDSKIQQAIYLLEEALESLESEHDSIELNKIISDLKGFVEGRE
jgi:hypothetical protein